MSAIGGKADIIQGKADIKKCPLMTQGGHADWLIFSPEELKLTAIKQKAQKHIGHRPRGRSCVNRCS
jgi:hypothetical protein